jgi:hypothetical protein
MVKTFVSNRPLTNVAEILKDCIHIDLAKASLYDKIRVGKIMRKLKWNRRQNRFGEWEYESPNNTNTVVEVANNIIKEEQINWEE